MTFSQPSYSTQPYVGSVYDAAPPLGVDSPTFYIPPKKDKTKKNES